MAIYNRAVRLLQQTLVDEGCVSSVAATYSSTLAMFTKLHIWVEPRVRSYLDLIDIEREVCLSRVVVRLSMELSSR